MKSIHIAILLLCISACAVADEPRRRAEEQQQYEQRQREAERQRGLPMERSRQAGICAAYSETQKKWTDGVWELAPDIPTARHAAEMWQLGFADARGTVKDSYLQEGERACKALGVPSPK